MLLRWLIVEALRILGTGVGSERSVIRGPPGLDHQALVAAPGYYGRTIPRTKGVRSRATVLQVGAATCWR